MGLSNLVVRMDSAVENWFAGTPIGNPLMVIHDISFRRQPDGDQHQSTPNVVLQILATM